MARYTFRPLAVVAMAALVAPAAAQVTISTKPSGPKFEVASIKPAPEQQNHPGPPAHTGIKIDSARVDIGFWSIHQLIQRAYGLPGYQIDGPDWINHAHFDVAAKLPEGARQEQLPQMLQWLLADRFRLAAHRETRGLNGFALVVDKGGPRMKAAADPDPAPVKTARVGQTLDNLWSYEKPFGLTNMKVEDGEMHLEFKKLPMDAMAQVLASWMRVPVIDQTGLDGQYEAVLDIPVGGPDTSGPSVLSMVRTLGLRLEKRKIPMAMLVVDHVDRAPSEN